ncbi:UNC5C-like protein [Watersipora subatra]|uniref:UNC5C-like protein n=1 Tax=Watersipora subatra TaxID=2589382 RepID=UPI00355BA2DA
MGLTGAVIALAILSALAILIVIPILAFLYYKKHRQARQLQSQLRDHEKSRAPSSKKSSNVYSLPCRLKKKPSSAGGSRSAAGESGVYDMAEVLQLSEMFTKQRVTASYPGITGELQRIHLFGELSSDDVIALKEVISSHLESGQPSDTSDTAQESTGEAKGHRDSLALDDIIISGLDPTFSFENEAYKRDEYESAHMNGTHKRRNQVKKTLSALSNKVKLNIRPQDKPLSKLSDIGSLVGCSTYTSCKSAVIGQSGGEMVLSSGVQLTIPPHALHEKVEVILGVTFDPKHLPQLSEEEALLTPVIFCQPSGTEFKQPVTLTLPHCAAQIQDSWKINILASETDVESPETDWKVLQIGGYESRLINKHEIQLCVNHFTMYCVTGTAKDEKVACKRKKLIALAPEQQPTSFSVYCVNAYHQRNSHQTGDPCPSVLNVESNGQSIKLLAEGLSDTCNQSPNPLPQISFLDAWHNSNWPVTFNLKGKDSNHDVSCDLCGWQAGTTSPKYKIALSSKCKSQMSNGVTNGKKRSVFSESLKWDIILLLDKAHPDGNDWKKMATELGLPPDTVKVMEECTSPTKELLRVWEEHSHGCIKSFVAMAVKIHRLDVAEKIEEHIGKLYLETLPNHKCDDHC